MGEIGLFDIVTFEHEGRRLRGYVSGSRVVDNVRPESSAFPVLVYDDQMVYLPPQGELVRTGELDNEARVEYAQRRQSIRVPGPQRGEGVSPWDKALLHSLYCALTASGVTNREQVAMCIRLLLKIMMCRTTMWHSSVAAS
jgi:hypothetical protein